MGNKAVKGGAGVDSWSFMDDPMEVRAPWLR